MDKTVIGLNLFGSLCTLFTFLLSAILLIRHVTNWTDPIAQYLTIPIIVVTPIYSLCSLIALLFPQYHIYPTSIGEVYGTWVLYSQLMPLLLHYLHKKGPQHFGITGTFDHANKLKVDYSYSLKETEKMFAQCQPILYPQPFTYLCRHVYPTTTLLNGFKETLGYYMMIRLLYVLVSITLYFVDDYVSKEIVMVTRVIGSLIVILFAYGALYSITLYIKIVREIIWPYNPLIKASYFTFILIGLDVQGLVLTVIGYSLSPIPSYLFTESYMDYIPPITSCVITLLEMAFMSIYNFWIFPYNEQQLTSFINL